jgi:hypothetical protein
MKKIIFSLLLVLFTGAAFAQSESIKFTARKNPANASQLEIYAKNISSNTITGILGSSNLTICIAFPNIYTASCTISSPISGQVFDALNIRSVSGSDSIYAWNGLGSTAEIIFASGAEVHIANVDFNSGYPNNAPVKLYNATNGGLQGFQYNYIAPGGFEHCSYANPFYSNIPNDPLLVNSNGTNDAFTQGNSYLEVRSAIQDAPILSVVNRCNGTSQITAKDESGVNIPAGELTWSNGLTGNPIVVSNTNPVTATRTVNGIVSSVSNTVTPAPGTTPIAGIINNTGTTILTCTTTSISLTATGGVSYVWDNELGTGDTKAITTPGIYTVSVSNAEGCVSQASIEITQNLAVPVMPAVVNGPVNICPFIGNGTQLVYSVQQDQVASSYQWVLPTNVVLVSGQGTNSITVTLDAAFANTASKLIKVRAVSDCGSSAYKLFYLHAQLPGTPSQITASSVNVCTVINTANTITYSIPKVAAATAYIWTAQAGNTIITHPNGEGTVNDTIVEVRFSSNFSSSLISVQAMNDCGVSNARSLLIARNNPYTPGLINGPTNICSHIAPGGTTATYSVAPVVNATSYNWTVPSGVTNLSGQGTASISFTYPSGFTTGSVSVTASNGCSVSAVRTLSVTKLNPATPGVIDVIQQEACPNRVYSYSIASMPANASMVQWSVPSIPGVIILSGQGTASIQVAYPTGAITGTVTAQAISNCGSSTIRQVAVKLPACPPPGIAGKGTDAPDLKDQFKKEPTDGAFDVNVFPNPSTSYFGLIVKSTEQTKLTARIFDMQGRLLKVFTVMSNEINNIGYHLKAGIYILEISEGKNSSTRKLIKQ